MKQTSTCGVGVADGQANRLYTPRDWQAEATIRATKLTGSPEGAQALVEAKRYGVMADLIETLQRSVAALTEEIAMPRQIDWGEVDQELRSILAQGNDYSASALDDLRALLRKVSGQ